MPTWSGKRHPWLLRTPGLFRRAWSWQPRCLLHAHTVHRSTIQDLFSCRQIARRKPKSSFSRSRAGRRASSKSLTTSCFRWRPPTVSAGHLTLEHVRATTNLSRLANPYLRKHYRPLGEVRHRHIGVVVNSIARRKIYRYTSSHQLSRLKRLSQSPKLG